jgi:hypothetical protein
VLTLFTESSELLDLLRAGTPVCCCVLGILS